MSRPRILAIVGSGETTPRLARLHRDLFRRLGPGATGALIDTTYGFQENADELSEKIVEYFGRSVGRTFTVASYRSRDSSAVETATAVARIDAADFVLAGPGSPTYALRHWTGGPIADALARKLRDGGVVVMASAAALTLGRVTMPVYEMYKVGADPTWAPGLDVLGAMTGLSVAVVPHYDNAEGGTHDTRFCYVGERRMSVLEELLPAGTFVLGVDGQTGLVLDLDRRVASVHGLGGVTVRVDGRSRRFEPGSEFPIGALAVAADELASEGPARRGVVSAIPGEPAPSPADVSDASDPSAALEAQFSAALGDRDVPTAIAALLEFDEVLAAEQGSDPERLPSDRARYRSLIVRLGDAAEGGVRDPHDVLAPFVDALLEARARAREAGDWATADIIRDRLVAAGVEVRDGALGSDWMLEGAARP